MLEKLKMNVRPYPMYKVDVANTLKAKGFVGPTAFQLIRKYKNLLDENFNNGILPDDCAENIYRALMDKPQTIKQTDLFNGSQCKAHYKM